MSLILFSVQGFLAVTVWTSNKCGLMKTVNGNSSDYPGPRNDADLLHFVEDVHMHLFFGMILCTHLKGV